MKNTMTSPQAMEINGVNVERLNESIALLGNNQELSEFRFCLTNRWMGGGHNRSTMKAFYGVGQMHDDRKQTFVMDADEPDVLLGRDNGANPAEFLLHALAACMTTSMVYHAAARGIRVRMVESTVEGTLDVRGFLGTAPGVRPGYQQIRVKFRIDADAPVEELRELMKYSPMYDSVLNPVNIDIQVEAA